MGGRVGDGINEGVGGGGSLASLAQVIEAIGLGVGAAFGQADAPETIGGIPTRGGPIDAGLRHEGTAVGIVGGGGEGIDLGPEQGIGIGEVVGEAEGGGGGG